MSDRQGPRRRPLAAILAGVVLAAGLTFLALHLSDVARFRALLRRAEPAWLALAIGLQAATYVAVAAGWGAVLARSGARRRLRQLIPIAVGKLFADQMVPTAGMSGNMLLVERLVATGVPRPTAMATLLVSMIGYYAAYALLALAMLFVLWLDRDATPLLVGLTTSFLLVALAIPSLALWLRARGSKPLPPWIERIRVVAALLRAVGEAPAGSLRDPRLLGKVAACQGAVFLCDAGTLAACLWALGAPSPFGTAFVAFIAASIVVTLGPIPFGLGTFEGTSVAMLHLLGVPIEGALAGTLLFRLLALWLPLVPGLVLVGRTAGGRGRLTR